MPALDPGDKQADEEQTAKGEMHRVEQRHRLLPRSPDGRKHGDQSATEHGSVSHPNVARATAPAPEALMEQNDQNHPRGDAKQNVHRHDNLQKGRSPRRIAKE